MGAFLAAIAGSVLFGFLVAGLTVPGWNDTEIVQAVVAIPGAVSAWWAAGPNGSRT